MSTNSGWIYPNLTQNSGNHQDYRITFGSRTKPSSWVGVDARNADSFEETNLKEMERDKDCFFLVGMFFLLGISRQVVSLLTITFSWWCFLYLFFAKMRRVIQKVYPCWRVQRWKTAKHVMIHGFQPFSYATTCKGWICWISCEGNKLNFGSVHVMCLEVFGVDWVVDFCWDWD